MRMMRMMRMMSVSAAIAVLVGCGAEVTRTPVPIAFETLQANAPEGVLPASPAPLHYDLDLTLDPRETAFGGTVTITLDFDAPAQGFFLHGRDIEVSAVRARQGRFGKMQTGSWTDVLPSGVAWVELGQQVDAGEVVVELEYIAPFDVNLSGLFKVTEQGDAYALAKSESIQARRFMPGFDQPAFKAPFDITLTIADTDVAISNGPVVKQVSLPGGLKRVTFATTRPLPTYLLSLAVGAFDVVDGGVLPPNAVRSEPVPLTGYARRGKGAELALALETAPELVRVFEEALQQPYPYKKLDIVAAPQWPSGATELAAAITYRESRILAGPDIGPAARRSLLAIHAHEVAHMWFGNLVTPPWWDDLWLKEAFASWGEGASLSVIYPSEGYALDAIQDGIRAMSLDSLSAARAVREPIRRNENVRNAYDAITYNKGLAIIGMVDAYFGADVFRPALGKYIAAYEDGVAASPDFFDTIGAATGVPDLTRVFESFVQQNGLPLITLDLENGQRLVHTQSRYVPLGGQGDQKERERTWSIPYCMRLGFQDGTTERVCSILNDSEFIWQAVDRNIDWVMPNADGVGYWRFSLSSDAWLRLAEAFPKLSPGEQLSAMDSIGAEYAAGRIGASYLWRFIQAATQSKERRVVQAALAHAAYLDAGISNARTQEAYRALVRAVFMPRLAALGPSEADTPEDAILRTELERFLIQTGREPGLRSSLAAAAAAYIGMPGVASDRDLSTDALSIALSVGVQTYGGPFIDQLLIANAASDDPVFQQAVAFALGQNEDPDLAPRMLDLVFAGELGSRESYTIMGGQLRQSATQAYAWERFQSGFARYLEIIPRQRKRATPAQAAYICTPGHEAALSALYAEQGKLAEGHERALVQTLERLALCRAQRDGQAGEVEALLTWIMNGAK